MIRFHRCAGAQFGKCLIESAEVSQDARAVVANHYALVRIQLQHSIQTAQSFVVIAIQPRDHAAHEMHARIVGRLALQLVNRRAGFRFFAARQVDKNHVHARFDQMRIEP